MSSQPTPLERNLFRASQISLMGFTGAWFVPVVLPKFTYDVMGMTERYWLDELVTHVFLWGFTVLPVLAFVMLLVGFLASPRVSRRTLNFIMVLNWTMALLMPLWMFLGVRELKRLSGAE